VIEAPVEPAVSVAGKPAEGDSEDPDKESLTELEQQLIAMGSQDNPAVLEAQVKEQERVIVTQQTERPLLQKQLLLDQEDEKAEEAEENGHSIENENGTEQTPAHHKHRHSLLNNDDRGIEVIERNLKVVHQAFYDEYRAKKKLPASGRVAELQGTPKKRIEEFVPDIKVLMPRIKESVLEGVTIVFSGIIPLGMDVQASDLALWVKSFGAEVSVDLNKHTTHVIANPDRKTTKVKRAARYPRISIVNVEWMLQCCTQWVHVDEGPYLIEMDADDRGGSPLEDLDDTDLGLTEDEAIIPVNEGAWEDMDKELEEFMNESDGTEDNSNSDSESIRSDTSVQPDSNKTKRKRKRHGGGVTDESGAEESDTSTKNSSRLQKKKKRTIERVSSLTNVLMAADNSSGLPSPETTGPEEDQGDEEGVIKPTGLDIAEDDYDDALEAEMLAEFDNFDNEDA
jgi:RNA polymerase II subunit A-like phosphatase